MAELFSYARIFCGIGLIPVLALGIILFRRARERDLIARFMLAMMPILIVLFGFRLFVKVIGRPLDNGDAVRLAPVFAFWQGYPLYPTPSSGPLLSYCYGPVTALAYLPIVIAPTPTAAVLSAAVVTVVLMLGPVLWVHLDRARVGTGRLTDGLYAFLAFYGLVCHSPGLTFSLFSPAHDAVGLCLGALATIVLCRRRNKESTFALLGSACLAVLAVWAKQTMAPILLALPLYILITDGIATCLRYVLFLLILGISLSLVFLVAFDPEGLIQHMFTIPLRHPRDEEILHSIADFQSELTVPAVIFIFSVLVCFQSGEFSFGNSEQGGGQCRYHYWLPFILVGILQAPLAIMANAKQGGYVNNLSFSLYYLALGTTALLSGLCASGEELLRKVAQSLLLALSLALVLPPLTWLKDPEFRFSDPLQVAFEFEKKFPGKAYFPWNTLSVLMAGGRAYHAEDGLVSCVRMAGMEMSAAQLRAFVPPHATLLALPPNYPSKWTNGMILDLLPEFRRRTDVQGLPGWTVFEREPLER